MEVVDLQASCACKRKQEESNLEDFADVCVKKSSKIYLLWQNKCITYLEVLAFVNKRSR